MDIKSIVHALMPGLAARWYAKRNALDAQLRLYQAAGVSQFHPRRGDNRSANAVMEHARNHLSNWARYLDENSDLAIGVLSDLVDNVVGQGIAVEPMIRNRAGELAIETNAAVRRLWELWGRAPEASQVLPWGEVQRLVCRSWLRDGDIFGQLAINATGYQYPTAVPFGLELLETDMVPFDLTIDQLAEGQGNRIIHGIEHDRWGRVTSYHVYRSHPADYVGVLTADALLAETKRIPAERMIHLKFVRRIRQARGVSILHGCTHRLSDTLDYEESERIAAKVASNLTGFIRKSPDMPGTLDTDVSDYGDRSIEMQAGMIWDNLLPGEEVQTIESNRPSNKLLDFRQAMLKAVSAGTGAKYSSIARTYDGTYSAQRQELVEAQPGYNRLRDYFVSTFVRRVYELWLNTAMLAGALDMRSIDPLTMRDARYMGPGMPWINPKDEVDADEQAVASGFKSRHQVIRERGGDPVQVDMERDQDDRDINNGETEDGDAAPERAANT